MAAGHDQDDREQAGDRGEVAGDARPPGLAGAGRGRVVEVLGDPVGIDDRDEPVDQDGEVDHEDGVEDARVDEEAEQRDAVDAQDRPGAECQEQDGTGREGQRAHRRSGIELAESGEDQGEECRSERRPRARSRALRFVHRG